MRIAGVTEQASPALDAPSLRGSLGYGSTKHALRHELGHTLKLGRRKRLFTPAQRKAIMLCDRHCKGPGCTIPANWDEVHHVRPWVDGGETDTENAILLCSRCHHEVHRGRLRIGRAGSRWRVRRTMLPPIRRRRRWRRRPLFARAGRAPAATG